VNVGGVRRLGRFAGVFVPLGIFLFFLFYFRLFDLMPFGKFLSSVFENAFRIDSLATGGLLALLSIMGQSIGAFCITIEMGIGKSAGVSGAVRTDYPFKQGLVAMLPPIFESTIIATLTVYLLFSYNAVAIEDQLYLLSYIFGFKNTIPGILFVSSFIILGMVSMSSWFHVGQQNAFYIYGEKFANVYRILFLGFILSISYLYIKLGNDVLLYIFNVGYTLAILTSIPVLVSLVILVKIATFEKNKYFSETGVKYEVFKDFYILLLTILPKNLISKLFGLFTYVRLPRFMMIPILKVFAKMYKINLNEAELNITEYNSLNQFFTRALKAGVRIIDSGENAAVSPVDARITNFGEINESTLIQAKGFDFSLRELLGSETYWKDFESGKFITFYLSPQDYHRIHSPYGGRILGYYYEPGKLFPVNDAAVGGIRSLFPKNERLITFLQTDFGKIAVVKVGASNVGKIRVTYDDNIVTNTWIRIPR
jgi:phosphatidylserine decarboxylase